MDPADSLPNPKYVRPTAAKEPGTLCLKHVADKALKKALRSEATERACTFCEKSSEDGKPFAVSIYSLVEAVTPAISRHYGDADNEGAPWDSEDGYMIATFDTQDVVNDICAEAFDANWCAEIIEAVVEAIGWDTTWVEGGLLNRDELDYRWEEFTKTVSTMSRFVFASPGSDEPIILGRTRGSGRDRRNDPPRRIGGFLQLLLSYVDGKNGLVVELPVDTTFHRGRLMAKPNGLEHTVENLRPAPPHKASANRMSPAGISMFYASDDPHTAISEIASHGPEPYALMGIFRNTRPLSILDFTSQSAMPSVFDENRHTELAMARFRRSFVASITSAIIPDGRQHIEYTPTQVITEYLRWAPERVIDGIALPSAQSNQAAKTYVLFFDADDCADKDQEEAARMERDKTPSLLKIGPDFSPTLLLAKNEIQVWKIRRRYRASKFSGQI